MNCFSRSNVNMANRLLCVHAHVAGQENAFLDVVVAPLLQAISVPGGAFFFLRYWRGGPHLRLRFRTPGVDEAALHGELVQRFERWCIGVDGFDLPDTTGHARLATRFAALEETEAETALMPCPALVKAPYLPESKKYGGDVGLAIAEQVWCASSAAALAANAAGLLGGGARLGLGLQMAIIGARAFGLDLAQAHAFFGRYAGIWQHYCPGPASAGLEQRLARQATGLRALAAAAWEGRHPPLLHGWHAAMQQACSAISVHAGALAGAMAAGHGIQADHVQNYLLSQYLHTNSNRLGIGPVDEWLMARLIQAALGPVHQSALPEERYACDTGS